MKEYTLDYKRDKEFLSFPRKDYISQEPIKSGDGKIRRFIWRVEYNAFEKILSNMECVALSTLFACYDDLEQIARGEFVENNNENSDCLASLIPDDEFFEILQELVNEYEKENDCDCDND